MNNIPKKILIDLENNFNILDIEEKDIKKSFDGTIKYLFKLNDNNYIESVLLKDINYRYTFCISTQSGCRMGCTFCKTGKMGLKRNLTYTEIISQILFLSSMIDKSYNIVFMGMGEPLDNFDNLTKAIEIIINNLKLSMSRITVSTCGITDKIIPLLEKFNSINLAVSLNSMIQKNREKIMPISKKYNINDLLTVIKYVINRYKNRITFEYVLIEDFNMNDDDLSEIAKLKEYNIMFNLIPANDDNIKLNQEAINRFYNELKKLGINSTKRYRRGYDINAACGQLYWDNNR